MSSTLQFSHGLDQAPNIIHMGAVEAEEYVKQHSDLYEITFHAGKKCRAFIDIDGCLPLEATEEEFQTTHQMILDVLSALDLGTPFSITTSSLYGNMEWKTKERKHKLSYGLIFLEKCGTKNAVSQWTREEIAPRLKEALEIVIPFYIKGVDKEIPDTNLLDYDNSVYRVDGKMRCVFSTKPGENRPRLIHSAHGVLDTMITYVPDECEELREPVTAAPAPLVYESDEKDSVLYKLVMSLSKYRAEDRKDWLTVGMALYNEGEDVEVWDEFSRQSGKYRWGECQRLWRGFRRGGGLTQRTLWKMLKEDNPDVFKAMNAQRRDLQKAFEIVAHVPYAEHFVKCCPEDYLYDVGSGWWFLQPNKTWANSGTKFPPGLTITISRTLYAELEEYRQGLRHIMLQKGEDLNPNSFEAMRMKNALDGTKSVLQAGFLKSVAEVCQGLYAEQTARRLDIAGKAMVKDMMDANPMIFAFKDAVYDFTLVDGVAVGKRPIEATDYIVTTCGYNFPTRNPVVRREMEKYLKDIWSKQTTVEDGEEVTYGDDGETYEYVMKVFSTTLCGTRWAEAFYILTGKGRNGKGLLFELLQAVMGDYYYPLPIQVLTTKIENPRAPNPDFANLVGKRMVCCTEPEPTERLQEGTIKEMTGGDKLSGRALYGAPVKFKPQLGLFLQCNTVPTFNSISKAGVLRNVVTPFPFIFVDQPSGPREKKGDPMIKDVYCKSPEWRDEMFFILLDQFESVRGKSNDAIPRSRLVMERTDAYIAENNAVGLWWIQTYKRDAKGYVLSRDAYISYKTDTGSHISDKLFKAALDFNDWEVKKITSGADKDKMGVKGWRHKTDKELEEERKKKEAEEAEPGSDDEKKEE
jgi:P4 family phage/plasmid primase-like protien